MQHDRDLPPERSPHARNGQRLPFVIYVLALGTFLMLTTEFVVAGLLPEIAADVHVSVAQAGLLITIFAAGMIVGAPVMSMLTLRVPRRTTLMAALLVFALGHVIVAVASQFATLLAARFLTAVATGAFWAVAAVVATHAAPRFLSVRAVGVVNAGGMLATVVGVPLGAFVGQVVGWRGTFWALAVLAVAVLVVIYRFVPHERPQQQGVSIRSELAALRSGQLWLALAACAFTSGGVLAAYSFISPLLTDRTGLDAGLVPLVLTGFGVGALAGSILGGRLGDSHPHRITILVPAVTGVVLLALSVLAGYPVATIVLVVLLGLFGLSANPVLIAMAVRFAGKAPTLGSSLAVSAFNFGTAVGSGIAGLTLGTRLGATGPVVVGTIIVFATVVPAAALALIQRRRATGMGGPGRSHGAEMPV
jgi:DHA1 family inner membrane transport protein